jgi:S1-C subfamily serine protease
MKSIVRRLAATSTLLFPILCAQAHAGSSADSVVKVFTQMRLPNPVRPWVKQNPVEVMGSGVVIERNRILTNAHLLSN